MTSPLDTVSCRSALPGEAAAIARLVANTVAFSNAYEYAAEGRARITSLYAADAVARAIRRRAVHVACDAKGLAGMVTLSQGRRGLTVEGLFVHPEVQGFGIGAGLLEYGISRSWSPPESGEAPRVTVLSSLTAEGFYARLGFERLREVPRAYGIAILMSRA